MAYANAARRASDKSPAGVENRSKRTPLSLNTNLPLNGKLSGEALSFKPAISANQYLLHGSTPDDGPLIVSSATNANTAKGPAKKSNPTPIGMANGISPTRAKVHFTTDVVPGKFVGSHCVKVQVSKELYRFVFNEMNVAFDWEKWLRAFFVMPESDDKKLTVYALLDDVRRAATVRANVNLIESTADVEYVTQPEFAGAQKEFASKNGAKAAGAVSSFYDGQVMIYAKFDGQVSACKPDGLEDQVRGMAQQFGEVLALGELDAKDGMARFRVEFCSIDAAKKMVKQLTPAKPADLGGWLAFTQELPDLAGSEKGSGVAGRGTPFESVDGDSSPTYVSLTGRTRWNVNPQTGEVLSASNNGSDRDSPLNRGGAMLMHPTTHFTPQSQLTYGNHNHGAMRQGPMAMQQFNHAQQMYMNGQQHVGPFRGETYGRGRNEVGDNSQAVDPETIREGLDVRTTIMLRNLPNQMTCHTLKNILNASNFGEYDFSYVRIDYKKGASVGYGFVNFMDPASIIKFLRAYAGRPWMPELPNRRGASRLAEVSYATVQGYDCCIEKFRNSSVMTEFVDYRPKLWFTKATAPSEDRIGEEVDFPPVNNASKHQRSLANATQIGLFPPQSRRGPGAMHRPGRSQFDRGTTAQQQEDMLFHIQQLQHAQVAQAGNFPPQANQILAPGQMAYPMPPMPPQQPAVFSGIIAYDAYGNPIFANPGAMMPTNPYYAQQSMNMAPISPQYMNGNGFNGHAAAGPQFMNGNGFNGYAAPVHRWPVQVSHGSNRDDAVPRTVLTRYDAEDHPDAFQGDVDVGAMTGYYNPMSEKKKKDDE